MEITPDSLLCKLVGSSKDCPLEHVRNWKNGMSCQIPAAVT